MSVDTKKKEKKGGRTLYALPIAFPCPFGPSWPPPLMCSVVSVAFSTHRALLVSCRRAAVSGVVLVPFRGSWGVVWRVLALTRWVDDGSGGGKWCVVTAGGGGGGGRSDDVSDEV